MTIGFQRSPRDSASNGETDDLTTTNVYDADDNLLRSTDSRDNTTRTSYNEHGQPTSQTDIFGNTNYTGYDQRGLPTSIRDTNGNVTRLKFDDRGNPTEIKDDNGNVLVTNTYNKFGEVLTTTSVTNRTTYFEYNDNGDQIATWITDVTPAGTPIQLLTETTYDAEGKTTGTTQTEILNPDTSPVESIISFSTTTYDLVGQVVGTNDQFSNAAETSYDIRGQQIESRRKAVNEAGETVWMLSRTVYDQAGQAILTTDSFEEGTTEAIQGSRSDYDAAGRVTKTERLDSVQIIIAGSGALLTSEIGATGNVISTRTSSYDNSGRTLSSTDNYGNVSVTTYNETGDVTQTRSQVKDETGAVTWRVSRTVYDEYGRSIVSTDSFLDATGTAVSSGSVFASRTLYDNQGRSVSSQRLQAAVVDLDPTTGATTLVSSGTVLYESSTVYDADGRLFQSVSNTGTITTSEYDSLGRQIATIGPALPLSEVGTSVGLAVPAGATTVSLRSETVYNAEGQVLTQRTNIRQFDTTGPDAIDASDVQETSFVYDHKGQTIRTTLDDGTFITSVYDDFGRTISETNQLGQTRTNTYDDRGQLIAVTLPAIPDPANGGQLTSPVYQYSYNAQGNMVQLTDPLNRDTRFTFNDRGQQLTRSLPLGFGADGLFGTLDDFGADLLPNTGDEPTLPEGEFTERMEYDSKGRQSLHVSFEGVVTAYTYDDAANGTGRAKEMRFYRSQTDYDNGLVKESQIMTYDAFGRMVETVWDQDHASSGTTVDTWTKEYDVQSRVLRVTSPTGDINYEYDVFGRQTKVFTGSSGTYTGDQSNPSTDVRYSYDILGRLAKVEAFEKNDVTVDVDPVATGNQPESESYAYDLLGNLDYEINPDGSTTDYSYDDLNRLTDIDEYRADTNTPNDFTDNPKLSEYSYTLRDDGKRESADEIIYDTDGTTPVSHTQFDWTYDDASRLTDEVFTDVGDLLAADNYQTSFEYDLTGNRLSKTTVTDDDGTAGFDTATDTDSITTYNQDVNDRITSESAVVDGSATESTAWGYTGTQQTSKTVTPASAVFASSAVSYSYNLQGRMSDVTVTTNDPATGTATRIDTIGYRYGTDGIRISAIQQIDSDADGTIDTYEKTEYLIDARNHTGYQQVLEETVTDANGDLIKKIVYTIGHDQISQTTFTPGGATAGETLVFHMDGHGSTRILTDLAGVIATVGGAAQIFHYTSYGNAINFQMANAGTQYLYSGEQFDARIGQQYLRARYYNAANGTFNRLDPFFGNTTDPQSFHKYLYTHGDPISNTDPSGLISLGGLAIAMSIGGALGGIGTSALFGSAGRSPAYGLIVGTLGGASLVYSYYRGILGRVLGESLLASAIVVVSQLVKDHFVPPQGPNAGQPISYVADGVEAFAWGSFIAAFAHFDGWGPDGVSGNNPTVQVMGEGHVTTAFQLAASLGAIAITATTAIIGVVSGGDTEQLRQQTKVSLSDELTVTIETLVGSIIPLVDGIAGEYGQKIPGFRLLNTRQRARVVENLIDIPLAAGGGVSLQQFISGVAGSIATTVVDDVFDLIKP